MTPENPTIDPIRGEERSYSMHKRPPNYQPLHQLHVRDIPASLECEQRVVGRSHHDPRKRDE
jgi:hypothetical protein